MSWLNDTIVAPATPPGEGAIAIVRMSGPQAMTVADAFVRSRAYGSLREAPTRTVINAEIVREGEVLDHPILLLFRAPASYTGEDLVELHLHGNPVIVEGVVALAVRYGARVATPGEFTRRAFVNGKMGLMQAESVMAMITSESEQGVFLAQKHHGGEIGRRLETFRGTLVDVLARLELELDFVEEGYSFMPVEEIERLLGEMRALLQRMVDSFPAADRLARGPRILLLGKPNAGKSSLFNALIGYARAIVSPVAGTTRDYLEERIVHKGVTLRLIDTAGIRTSADHLESEGIERAKERIPLSDHVCYLIDSSDALSAQAEIEAAKGLMRAYPDVRFSIVWTKRDIAAVDIEAFPSISIIQPASIDRLLDLLAQTVLPVATTGISLLNRRQAGVAARCLERVLEASANTAVSTEILSAQLRSIMEPLSELTGAVTNEDVLDTIFGSFCIGK